VGKAAFRASAEQERRLVEAAQKDPARFADLYEENFERVYAFVARRVQDRDRTEDLTSDIFYKALAALPQFDWRGIPFSAWLLRIAANVVTDHWKRSGREVLEDPPDLGADPKLEELEHRARLFRQVEQLPPDQKRVIYLRFAEEKSIREIAQKMKRTEGAIKQLQFRGLQTLRNQLGEQHG
jgi:RNA polymerase sigma-70 factor (ECF subfamily)